MGVNQRLDAGKTLKATLHYSHLNRHWCRWLLSFRFSAWFQLCDQVKRKKQTGLCHTIPSFYFLCSDDYCCSRTPFAFSFVDLDLFTHKRKQSLEKMKGQKIQQKKGNLLWAQENILRQDDKVFQATEKPIKWRTERNWGKSVNLQRKHLWMSFGNKVSWSLFKRKRLQHFNLVGGSCWKTG